MTDMQPYLIEGNVKHLWNRKHEESNTGNSHKLVYIKNTS